MREKPVDGRRAGYSMIDVGAFVMLVLAAASFVYYFYWTGQVANLEDRETKLAEETRQIQEQSLPALTQYEQDLIRLATTQDMDEASSLQDRMEEIRSQVLENLNLPDDSGLQLNLQQLLFLTYLRLKGKRRNVQQKQRNLNRLNQRIEMMENKQASLEEMFDNQEQQLRDRLSSLNERRNELEATREELDRQIQTLEDSLNTEPQQLQEQLVSESVSPLEAEQTQLQREINEMVEREVREIELSGEDGRIVRRSDDGEWVHINIGEKDGLKPGVHFRVFRYNTSGEEKNIAYVEVKQVEQTHSRAQVTEKLSTDEIIRGDRVFNPLFSTDRPLTVAFAGSFNNLDQLKRHTRRAGADIRSEVSVHIDFLIGGTDHSEDEMTEQARELGVPLVQQDVILPYLGN